MVEEQRTTPHSKADDDDGVTDAGDSKCTATACYWKCVTDTPHTAG